MEVLQHRQWWRVTVQERREAPLGKTFWWAIEHNILGVLRQVTPEPSMNSWAPYSMLLPFEEQELMLQLVESFT